MPPSEKEYSELLQQVLQDSDITLEQIPALDLYMDQIITLVDNQMGKNRRRPDEKLLTKTMINNYSKDGLISPIKGKKYSRAQILQILLIYSLKQTLSIQDIKPVLSQIPAEELPYLYSCFLGTKEELRSELPILFERLCQNDAFKGLEEDLQRVLLLLSVASASNYFRRLSEQIIDRYFFTEPHL